MCYHFHKKYYFTGENIQKENRPPEKAIFKEREFQHIFEGIEDEIAILTATVKFNFTICKSDKNTLKLTLAYIEDPQKLIELLKNRMNLLMETTS